MTKPPVNRTKAIAISIVLSVVGITLLVALVAIVTQHRRRRQRETTAIRPLDLDDKSDANVVAGNLFSGDQADTVQEYQTECLLTADACTAFSDECCPGLICVPVNQTTSVCSHFKGSICINTGMICNDAVYGVECCDGGVCTPEGGGTGRSRCVLPTAAQARTDTKTIELVENNPTLSPSSRPSLRPVH